GDNASNNYSCAEILQNKYINMKYYGCFAHTLNIILQSGLFKNNDLIIKVRSIVNDIVNSPKLITSIINFAETNKFQFIKLKSDVSTRWNSTYLMLESFERNKHIFTLLSETNILSEKEWTDMHNIMTILKPFYTLSIIIS